jgi:8-oxo-dGTP pyrophosphatase MutT (NUDIX family)
VALLRLAYRCAYVVLWCWAFVAHPRTRGVKVVVDDGAGNVVFVRHTYGTRAHWELPGGGAHRGEDALAAARREAREELGHDIAEWTHLATAAGEWHGKSESLECFGARWPGGPVRHDRVEIAHAAWYPLAAPPSPLGPSTRVALRSLLAAA